jgi:hypothetical protein
MVINWQVILRGRDFILIFNIKDIMKKRCAGKKSLPLKITCHLLTHNKKVCGNY